MLPAPIVAVLLVILKPTLVSEWLVKVRTSVLIAPEVLEAVINWSPFCVIGLKTPIVAFGKNNVIFELLFWSPNVEFGAVVLLCINTPPELVLVKISLVVVFLDKLFLDLVFLEELLAFVVIVSQ